MRNARFALLAAGLLAILSVFIAGCGRKSIAKVNGEAITKDEYYQALEMTTVPGPNGQQIQAGPAVLGQLIQRKLVAQLAKDKDAAPTDEDVTARIKLMQRQGQIPPGADMNMVKDTVRDDMARTNIIIKGEKVSNKEAQDYYNANKKGFDMPERVQVAMLFSANRKNVDQAFQMVKDGQEFTTIAPRFADKSPNGSPEAGAVEIRKDNPTMPDAIKNAAFDTRKGEVADPFQATMGKDKKWCLLKVMDKRPPLSLSFDDAKPMISDQISLQNALVKKKIAPAGTDFSKVNPQIMKLLRDQMVNQQLLDFAAKAKIESGDKAHEPWVKNMVDNFKKAQAQSKKTSPAR